MGTESVAYKLKRSIASIAEGEVFDYRRFNQGSEQAVLRTLSRLTKSGELVRIEKGKYYKPRQSRFGLLRPGENQVLKTQTLKNDKVIGYLTGTALYNQLGLTTQVSNELVIVRNGRLPEKEINGYRLKFVARPIKLKKNDIPLLQLLDVLKDIKDIPDTSIDKTIPKFVKRMQQLSEEELNQKIRLSMDYNPATRALLGAILECYFPIIQLGSLRRSLNPLTKYKLGISQQILYNKTNWNIE
jgi:hypothetical protein